MTRLFQILVLPVALLASSCSTGGASVTDISQEELIAAPASILILDVRSPKEFASGHIPNALNISHNVIAERLAEIERYRDVTVVVYCESGVRAGRATSILTASGFTKVRHLAGDMSAWRERSE
jgi:rhodanese-related sulfurtransferase